MASVNLPPDFRDFLRLLKDHQVERFFSGVDFESCYAQRVVDELDGVEVNLIDLEHLKINKAASGRYKDLNDLEHLP
ncbi:MAG: hypothetical protein GXP42_15445 [Chloroflexi bacterium]|nr:hypothetical protein [Chloroflexota bacterium]